MKWIKIIFAIFICQFSLAQNIEPIAGARGLAMGNAALTFIDINSIFSNQAGLAWVDETEVILLAGQKYFVNEIRNIAAAVALPADFGTFGLNLQYYGFQDYNEQKVGFNYARKLAKNLSLGAQIFYFGYRIPEYGTKNLVSAEIGIRSQVLDKLVLAAHLANPVRVEIIDGEDLPTILSIGVAYLPSEKLTITAEAEKDIDFPASVKMGLEYRFAEAFFARIGVATGPVSLGFGMGIHLNEKLIIDAAASYHQTLGFSPALALRFVF